jgi:ubiquinone/menaquinone biosynthesis C-methylase UbiE
MPSKWVEKGITSLALYDLVNPPNKREVKANYGELGGGLYDLRYREEQDRKYDVALLTSRPRENDLLLDDGCGTGMLMARLESSAIGLDLTPSLIETAKEKLREGHHLILGDAERLPIRGGVFDGIYAITVIQNTPDRTRAVSEMSRVARRGGRVLVTALKVVFGRDLLIDLVEEVGLVSVNAVGDAGINDWIVYSEKP